MKKFSVVRVYSKSLERKLYPIPRTLTMTRKSIVQPPDEVDHAEPPDTVLLHRLIRDHKLCRLCEQSNSDDESSSLSDRIKAMDSR